MTWLLVEDDNDIRNIVSVMITVWGEKALAFPDGYAAWNWLDTVSADSPKDALPSLALMDIRMPGYTGDRIAARIRETEPIKDIPIILMTAFTVTESELKVMREQCGVDHLINKPLPDMDVFRALLLRIRDERQALVSARQAHQAKSVAPPQPTLASETVPPQTARPVPPESAGPPPPSPASPLQPHSAQAHTLGSKPSSPRPVPTPPAPSQSAPPQPPAPSSQTQPTPGQPPAPKPPAAPPTAPPAPPTPPVTPQSAPTRPLPQPPPAPPVTPQSAPTRPLSPQPPTAPPGKQPTSPFTSQSVEPAPSKPPAQPPQPTQPPQSQPSQPPSALPTKKPGES